MSEQPARYQRSFGGLVGALLLTLLLIGSFVLLRACNTPDLAVRPKAVDYLSDVRYAQQAGARLAYPPALPAGWIVTAVDFTPGTHPAFGLSMLTPAGEYVGLRQDPRPVSDLLTTYVDPHAHDDGPVTIAGALTPDLESWSDTGGDHALSTTYDGDSVLVFGSAKEADLHTVVEALTTKPVRQGGS
ncbi:MAG: DUF4245 family protein [Nocardioides sp.]